MTTLDVVTLGVVCADVMVRPVEALPPRGKLTLVPSLEIHLGGLAAVTATVLCQLGAKAAFIGKVGTDGFGDYIVNTLRRQHVNVDALAITPAHATSATVVLISGDGERTFLHHLGANAHLSESDVNFDMLGRARLLHWGGPAILPGLDGAPIGRILAKARSMGLMTSMDTCYDGKDVWFPHIEHALPHLDIVMSSIEEARKYTGAQEPEEIADFYCSFGVKTVLVKLGAEGLYVKNQHEAHHVPAHNVTAVDTTGAGDAACGGFLYGYLQGWDLLRCARLANAVGGLTVQKMGGAEAITSLADTLAFMEGA
ncbi:MAG: carbohydrate kinase family protein [Candidatus Hydrogenedentes bacterium]|nr:carbohydrate kinase family protein [Candidatus Hydrogenedentota bacterium]